MKKLALVQILLLITIPLIGRIIHVNCDDNEDYRTISEAINVAVTGDEIIVRNGTYFDEKNLSILLDQHIILRSENNDPQSCIIKQTRSS